MAVKTTLNQQNLMALGAERLSHIILQLAEGNAQAKRQLRLELASAQSPDNAAHEVRKRLTSISRAKTRIHWRKQKAFAADLEFQRIAIVGKIGKKDPKLGLSLLWEFLNLAEAVRFRASDGQGAIAEIFEKALSDLPILASAADPHPIQLANDLFNLLKSDRTGQFDGTITKLATILDTSGILELKSLVLAHAKQNSNSSERTIVFAGTTFSKADLEKQARMRLVRAALMEIADITGDADTFIAQFEPTARKNPGVAAEIAERLLKSNRAEEALLALDQAKLINNRPIAFAWQDMRANALIALDRMEEAQSFRLECFRSGLQAEHLRAYLKTLPDFDDIIAEKSALDDAVHHAKPMAALQFFLNWPSLSHADRLVRANSQSWNGDFYHLLTPAAQALGSKYKLSAIILRRAMINYTLTHARAKRYGYAAEHLIECSLLAMDIPDFQGLADHESFVDELRRHHGRKTGFWAKVG